MWKRFRKAGGRSNSRVCSADMIRRNHATGLSLLALLCSGSVLHAAAQMHTEQSAMHPVYETGFVPVRTAQPLVPRADRKFAEKPNAMKKVALDDIDDIQTNQIQESGGFSWSNMLAMFMQMIFNGGQQGPNKSEGLDETGVAPSPWANLLSVGLKILTALLGGGASSNDGIDKVDNGSPMQGILAAVLSAVVGNKDPDQVAMMAKQSVEFINIVVNLLDALKTSFSHRSMAARTIGKKDSISDAALASIAMMKSYVRSLATQSDKCMQKYVCEANRECTGDIGQSSIFCQLGTYATSFVIERSSGGSFDTMYEAGRRGRSGDNCRQIYLECNEV